MNGSAICAIVFSLLTINCLGQKNTEKRIITVAAFADDEFRKYDEWELFIERNINKVSLIYDSLFGIQFHLSSLNEWVSADDASDFSDLYYSLEEFTDPCTTDIVIGFSLQSPSTDEKKRKSELETGLSSKFGSKLAVRFGLSDLLYDEQVNITLLHEIAHLFGAWHCSDSSTIMGVSSKFRPRPVFDNQTLKIIRLMKNFPFCRGVLCLEENAHSLISKIYNEGHLEGEENPIAAALNDVATKFAEKGLTDSAAFYFHFAIPHYDTTSSLSLSNLFIALWFTNKKDSAIVVAKTVIHKDPKDKIIRYNLGELYLEMKAAEEALVHFERAIELDSMYTFALYGSAKAYLELNDTAKAIERIKATLSVAPNHSKAMNLSDSIRSKGFK